MKKDKFGGFIGVLPLSVQSSNINTLRKIKNTNGIKAANYQCSNNVSSQQFYKPISKTLSF